MGPIGGWRNILSAGGSPLQASSGIRQAFAWIDNAAQPHLALGSASALYIYTGSVLSTVTPTGMTPGNANGGLVAGNYGTGLYGVGYYGTGSGGLVATAADTWQFDNFGEDLVACQTGDGHLYEVVSPFTGLATVITNAPVANRGVVVTPEDFLVALGAGGIPRLVQWADQASLTSWTPAVGSQAGSFPLASRGRLMAGRRMKAFTMLWTDTDVWQMIYIGSGSNAYAFQQAGDNCGLIAPNAIALAGQVAYWMSQNKFFLWNGTVQPLNCDVLDYVFSNLNNTQRSKIVAMPNTMFDEIMWLYPSLNANENDSYVAYNTREQTWAYGALQRNAGADRGPFQYPIMIDPSGYLYEHEVGNVMNDGGVPFVESGPYDLMGGDQVLLVQRLLSDEAALGDTQLTMFGAINPTDAEFQLGPMPMAAPLTFRMPFTRYVRLRFDQVNPVPWRIGVMRFGVLPGGYR
jgi:hypothetical protein